MSTLGGDAGTGRARPGPVYDGAVRSTMEGGLEPVFTALDLPPPRREALQATEFPAKTLRADLLVQVRRRGDDAVPVADGLVHMEYETSVRAGFSRRMVEYRGRVLKRHPGERVRQYVLVLGDGDVDSCDDAEIGFALGLTPIYLREYDPAAFLTEPAAAPFAALAAGDAQQRKKALVAALRLILTQGGPRKGELLQSAERLAAIRLDAPTIQEARKESGMNELEAVADFYEEMDVGQEIRRRGRDEGRVEGRVEGRDEGRVEGEATVLAVLLRTRFGDRPEITAVAERLAAWPDPEAAVHAVMSAASIADIPAGGDDIPAQRQP